MSENNGGDTNMAQSSNGSGPWGTGGGGNGGGKGPWGGSNKGDGSRGSGGQGPWGGGSGGDNSSGSGNGGGGQGDSGGINVESLFNRARRNVGGGGGGGGRGGRRQSPGGVPRNLPLPLIILGLLGAFGIVWWNAGGVRLVSPSQELVVTFLGKYQTTKGEGLQIQWRSPLQRSYVINVLQQRETPVGANGERVDVSAIIERRNQRLAQTSPRASSTTETLTEEDFVEPNVVLQELQNETRGRLNQNLMLTNEGKIADVDVNVFWNVANAQNFLFNVKDPSEGFGGLNSTDPTETIKLAAEAALRSAVATRTLDEVVDRTGLAQDIESQLQALLDEYGAGINVVRVDVPYAQPPLAVLPSYNAVKNAEKTKNEIINKAQAEATRVINEAQGTVDKVLQEATAFKNETVAAARGEAQRFNEVLDAYAEAPEVTVQRLYLDTMREVLTTADTTIVDGALGGDTLPLLPLSPLNQ